MKQTKKSIKFKDIKNIYRNGITKNTKYRCKGQTWAKKKAEHDDGKEAGSHKVTRNTARQTHGQSM